MFLEIEVKLQVLSFWITLIGLQEGVGWYVMLSETIDMLALKIPEDRYVSK